MKILVAGGAGFLGANMCDALMDRGDTVFCLDNLSTGSAGNIKEHFGENRFHFIPANVVHLPDMEIELDQIYNFASPAAPGDYKADPQGTFDTNIEGTWNLLKLAERTEATLLQVSTVRVAEPSNGSPHAPYIDGKRRAEELCMQEYAKGVKVKIARLNNIYGPKMRLGDSRVVPQFVLHALRDEPLVIWGSGNQKDSFCYVDDLVEGLIAYMNSDIAPGPIEFGEPKPISIYDLAFATIKATGSLSTITTNGVNATVQDRWPDIGKAKVLLGWEPKVPLDIGLMRLVDYYGERI